MEKFFFGILFGLITSNLYAQPDTIWTKIYGGDQWDCGYTVKQTQDMGYILIGLTESFSTSCDIILIKTDPMGEIEWQ